MDKRIFFTFHILVIILSVWLVSMEYFSVDRGILEVYTKESGFYELGSGLFLFSFGLFLLVKATKTSLVKIRYALFLIGFVFILGALEELSWGQHLLGYESIEFADKHNYQHEMNFHNFIPAWFFGLTINLSFYIFFVFIPILIYFYRSKIQMTKYAKYDFYLDYFPSLELVLVFIFGFTLQKYFILDTATDTIALVIALGLLGLIAFKKRELFFSLHLFLLVIITAFFMLSHEVFSYQNLQYEVREFVFIYALIFWISNIVNSVTSSENKTK